MKPSSAYRLAAVAIAACLCYASLVPFDFTRSSLAHALNGLAASAATPFWRTSRSDFATNVALAVPLGFCLFAAMGIEGRTRRRTLGAGVLSMALVTALAGLMEVLQSFVPQRTASVNDIWAQAFGGALGVLIALASERAVTQRLQRLLAAPDSMSFGGHLLMVYAAGYVLSQLVPFDFTVRPAELLEKMRDGRVVLVPFADADTKSVWAFTLDALLIAPLGALWCRRVAIAPAWSRFVMAACVGAAVATSLELTQLFVASRVTDVTDVLSGMAGFAAGAAVRLHAERADEWWWRRRALAAVAILVWVFVLAAYAWYPYHWAPMSELSSRLRAMSLVPFYSYYVVSPFQAMTEATRKLLLGIPLGVFLTTAGSGPTRRLVLPFVAAVLILTIVEAGQLAVPGRYADPSDVIIGAAGAAIGVAIAHRYSSVASRRRVGASA